MLNMFRKSKNGIMAEQLRRISQLCVVSNALFCVDHSDPADRAVLQEEKL